MLLYAAQAPSAAPMDAADVMQGEFAALSENEQSTPEEWFALAQASRQAGDLRTAKAALKLADGLPAPQLGLERARIAIAGGHRDKAMRVLKGLFENGFTSVGAITGDELLNSMAGSSEYDSLMADMSRQAFPCEHNERFSEFDFWLGDWDVHIADGTYAGHNRIRRAERGCVVTENWVGSSGGTGMSINYFDLATDEWVQVWNSAGGSQIHIRGGLTDEGMALSGTIHYVATGTTAPFRGLWTLMDDGRVRQFFEQSSDDGRTWSTWFEGFYSRQTGTDRHE